MATLKLKKDKPPVARPRSEPRGPVRGIAAPRKQRTLAQAQAERSARAEPQRRPAPDTAPRDESPPRREPRRDKQRHIAPATEWDDQLA